MSRTLEEFIQYGINVTELYIIGTGPSLRVFPVDFLSNKFTIGLNQAYKVVNCSYNITVHPELIPENRYNWITKKKGESKTNWEQYILFTSNFENHLPPTDFSLLTNRKHNSLYMGRGVHTAALALAAAAGVRTAVMVGVDCLQLGNDHHCLEQHIQFHGLDSDNVYREYYRNTTEIRRIIKNNYGMDIISLSPFIGLGREQEEYIRLKEEYDLPDLPQPNDISTYNRRKIDFE